MPVVAVIQDVATRCFIFGTVTQLCKGVETSDVSFPPLADQIQHGHADGQAVGDLLEDATVRPVRDFGGNLHAAIDGAWMHDEDVLLAAAQTLAVEAVKFAVFPQRGELAAAEPLELDPQDVDGVHLFQHVVEAVADGAAHGGDGGGHQRRRAYDDHLGPEFFEAQNIAAGHAAVGDVADDGDLHARDAPQPLAQRENVQQRDRKSVV